MMPRRRCAPFLPLVLALAGCRSDAPTATDTPPLVAPPFGGTIFIAPDIITPSDPTAYSGLTYAGRGTRTMYDRRVASFVTLEPYLFDATFDDGLAVEVQVNPEFGNDSTARVEAEVYAEAVGRLPAVLRANVETMWVHRGTEPFGGGNQNILIHTGQAAVYAADGILEETLVHEAAHTSLDDAHESTPGWIEAQAADPTFISEYARDNPGSEDIAESFLPWLAVRYRVDRISASLRAAIEEAIPNRIAYFDGLGLDVHPIE